MIILVGGTSCTGKTLMSQKLLEKYKIPYFSIDHLKMGLFRADNNCGFTPMDSNEVIGVKLWPIIKSSPAQLFIFFEAAILTTSEGDLDSH